MQISPISRHFTLTSLLIFVSACGGGGSGDSLSGADQSSSVAGRWRGTVQLEPANSCVPDEGAVDLAGQPFTFDVSLEKDGLKQVVIDQDGYVYLGNSVVGVENGSFFASGGSSEPVSGPTGIEFFENDGQTARVKLIVFYNRFCATTFVGDFAKIGPVDSSGPQLQEVDGLWRGDLSVTLDECGIGAAVLNEQHQVSADSTDVTLISGDGRTLSGQRERVDEFIVFFSNDQTFSDEIRYSNISNGVATVEVERFENSGQPCQTRWVGQMRVER